MYNREGFLKYDFEYKLYEPIMKFVSENDFDDYPTIKSFYLTLKLVKNREHDNVYHELKKYLIKNADLMEMEDKKLVMSWSLSGWVV